MKRILRRVLLVILLAAFTFIAGSWVSAQRLTRARQQTIGAPPQDFPYPVQDVRFLSSDGETLAGWLVPAKDQKNAIVLLHGYGGSRKQMLPRARFFRQQGYTALLYDARGCGESSGDAISFGYHERHDLLAAVITLKSRGYKRIACLGVSQGGATILFAAEDLPELQCVICESVYDEMTHALDRRMRRYTGLPGWLGACAMVPFAENRLGITIDEVKPVDHVAKLRCPLFVVSGDCDDRTWPEDTHRLFDAAREPKELWMLEGAEHEDLFRHAGYEEKVSSFLRRHQ